MSLESIALIPSGYKANKLYCQLPVDGSADLTTSRASGATRVNKNGLIEDVATGVPRLDYLNGGCPELLLEPQITNLVTYSEEFDNVAWTKTNSSVTANTILSPDGSVNADKLVEDATASSTHFIAESLSFTSGQDYTISLFVKVAERNIFRFQFGNLTTAPCNVLFDLSDQTFTETLGSAKIQDYGNGWYRCSVSFTAGGTGSTNFNLFLADETGNTTYTGDGTSGIYVWGAQAEELSYPTSYIRTSGSAVTRIADAVTGNSSLGQVINSSEGVLYAEMSALANDGTQNLLGLNGGSISNSILFGFSSSNGIRFYGAESGTATGFDLTTAATITTTLKLALSWSLNDVKFYINGTQVGTDTSFATSSSLDALSFDNGSGSNPFYGRVRELKVYDTALTDAELTTLTTL